MFQRGKSYINDIYIFYKDPKIILKGFMKPWRKSTYIADEILQNHDEIQAMLPFAWKSAPWNCHP